MSNNIVHTYYQKGQEIVDRDIKILNFNSRNIIIKSVIVYHYLVPNRELPYYLEVVNHRNITIILIFRVL